MKRATAIGLSALALASIIACARDGTSAQPLSSRERSAIADSVRQLLVSTINFDSGDVVRRFMSLYPASGRVVSASNGTYTTTRDSLEMALKTFWDMVGKRMRNPKWVWGPIAIDVLGRDAVVVTAKYSVAHWTPAGAPHVIGGTWTSAWSRRDGRWVIVQEHLSDFPRSVAVPLEAAMPHLPDSSSK